LQWSINKGVKVIHLSLGTVRDENRPLLEGLCRQAQQAGVVAVSAARSPGDRIYPAVFDSVIGACWNKLCKAEDWVYHAGMPIEFGAYGRPREIPGLAQERNFGGASFAAARITAAAAAYLQRDPTAGTARVREFLISRAKGDTLSNEFQVQTPHRK
jgi:hypothetical protein